MQTPRNWQNDPSLYGPLATATEWAAAKAGRHLDRPPSSSGSSCCRAGVRRDRADARPPAARRPGGPGPGPPAVDREPADAVGGDGRRVTWTDSAQALGLSASVVRPGPGRWTPGSGRAGRWRRACWSARPPGLRPRWPCSGSRWPGRCGGRRRQLAAAAGGAALVLVPGYLIAGHVADRRPVRPRQQPGDVRQLLAAVLPPVRLQHRCPRAGADRGRGCLALAGLLAWRLPPGPPGCLPIRPALAPRWPGC